MWLTRNLKLQICQTFVKFPSQFIHYAGLCSSKRNTHDSAKYRDGSLLNFIIPGASKTQMAEEIRALGAEKRTSFAGQT